MWKEGLGSCVALASEVTLVPPGGHIWEQVESWNLMTQAEIAVPLTQRQRKKRFQFILPRQQLPTQGNVYRIYPEFPTHCFAQVPARYTSPWVR